MAFESLGKKRTIFQLMANEFTAAIAIRCHPEARHNNKSRLFAQNRAPNAFNMAHDSGRERTVPTSHRKFDWLRLALYFVHVI